MKTTNKIFIASVLIGLTISCKQDLIKLTEPTSTPSKGNADFTKFVAIGNSLAAGYQAGALFDSGQINSFPAMMAKQFALVGGGAFNQPTINSVNGFSANIGINVGRYILFDPDGPTGPRTPAPYPAGYPGQSVTCPSSVVTPPLPAPYNTADAIGAFSGNKSALNNFGVPGILLAQLLTPATGGPASSNPAFNPYYARFASNPSVDGVNGSTILGDAVAAAPSFFLLEIGNNDVLGYATTGGNGTIPITDPGTFGAYYDNVINTLLGSNTNLKGVIATIPDVTSIPHFFTVPYNAIPLDAPHATAVMTGFAGYNQILDAIIANGPLMTNFGLNAADLTARKISFTASSTNNILIADKTLTDLGAVFDYLRSINVIPDDPSRAALTPYQKVRQTTAKDLITLPAGAVLGTCYSGNPQLIIGVSWPLDDKYALVPSETASILTATAAYNTKIKSIVAANPTRLALADVNAAFNSLVSSKIQIESNVAISPSFIPPYGGFSEDGVHPNTRGYAFLANIYLSAINATFSANVPLINIAIHQGTAIPVNP